MGFRFRSKKSFSPGMIDWGKPRVSGGEGFFGERRWPFGGQLRDLMGDLDERNGLAVKFHSIKASNCSIIQRRWPFMEEGSEGSTFQRRVVPAIRRVSLKQKISSGQNPLGCDGEGFLVRGILPNCD
jgi:hypothetical protein